jgi:hypothetical protein
MPAMTIEISHLCKSPDRLKQPLPLLNEDQTRQAISHTITDVVNAMRKTTRIQPTQAWHLLFELDGSDPEHALVKSAGKTVGWTTPAALQQNALAVMQDEFGLDIANYQVTENAEFPGTGVALEQREYPNKTIEGLIFCRTCTRATNNDDVYRVEWTVYEKNPPIIKVRGKKIL